jgi:hypothetical protein
LHLSAFLTKGSSSSPGREASVSLDIGTAVAKMEGPIPVVRQGVANATNARARVRRLTRRAIVVKLG